MHIDQLITGVPPIAVYLVVGLIVGLESLGIPLPGELVLMTAAITAATGAINPWGVAIAAVLGAVIGDSIGYSIGRRGGPVLFERLGKRFPKHFGPDKLAVAEQAFQRWGMWAVFFGRFIALLRIFAGPLAGVLRMPYWRFLVANVLGGILWAGGTTLVLYKLGKVAEQWLKGFAWVALLVAVVFGAGVTLVVKRRAARALAEQSADADRPGAPLPVDSAVD